MARFDVYRYTGAVPLVLDVQADLFADLNSRVVIPLWPQDTVKLESAPRLKPLVTVNDESYILTTTDLAAVPVAALGPLVANLDDQRQTVIDALDFLLQGF